MVLVRVREDDRIQSFLAEVFPKGLRLGALVFGVGTAIQYYPAAAGFQKITVGSDFDLAGEIGKTEMRHAGCGMLGGGRRSENCWSGESPNWGWFTPILQKRRVWKEAQQEDAFSETAAGAQRGGAGKC